MYVPRDPKLNLSLVQRDNGREQDWMQFDTGHRGIFWHIGPVFDHLYHEARALNIEVMCYMDLGDYKTSISQCHRGRKLLGLCDRRFMSNEAEIHLLKSEYVEAHSIHTQIVQTTSADQDADSYAFGLLNLSEVDIMSGERTLNLREGLDIPAKTTFLQYFNSRGHDSQGVLLCMERLADVKLWSQQAKEIIQIQTRIVAVEQEILITHPKQLAKLKGLNVPTAIIMFEVGTDENPPLIEELDENGAISLVAS
ncbi:hypothetical protein DFH07DRAFT_763529 [Mycena maculata]|uniref:Uncharacterized protein n=1 Tax=Mycena maculata TaxID=230809 RepID=A0AAD7KG34_9AGAR|nr:hypothetical protein DFH07DRAFT_763529 [Mycena maculata]